MKYFCKELNKEFDSPEAMFKALRDNKSEIINLKKSQVYKSHEKGLGITAKPVDALKLSTAVKAIKFDEDFYYLAVNSTLILDSHRDLHVSGIWNKTVKDRQGMNYLVADHMLGIGTTIARKEHIEMFVVTIPFALIGKEYEGNTEVLIYKVKKDKIIHPVAKEWLDSGDDLEASVRMQYVEIKFAVKSDDKEDSKARAVYDNYIDKIVNKDDFDREILYFWVVRQAKNIMESSLVLFGSNSATGQLVVENKIDEPGQSTLDKKPEEPIQDKGINYTYLINNLKI